MSILPTLHSLIRGVEPELIALRRHLHAHPELSHREQETTQLLSGRIRQLGLSVHARPEGTGFYADLTPAGFDPAIHRTVAIRTDLDALPIHEQNEDDHRSTRPGVMHACGHDAHMTAVTGAALGLRALADVSPDALPGRVRFIYQHAEESSPSGAPDMVAFGAMDGVDMILGLHCDPERPCGQIGVRVGALTASYDQFSLRVIGRGGHGARPHQSVDPIFVATQLAQALYQATGRLFDAREAMVLSIGELRAGHAPNVIPDDALLRGTVRTLGIARRAEVEPTLRRIAQGVCDTWGASYELELYRGSPPVINDARAVEAIRQAATALLEPGSVEDIALPSMGGEDFAHLLARAPGAMFRLGTARPGRAIHLLHTPRFDIDERALVLGAQILASAAWSLLCEEPSLVRAQGA
jgi:amidohydrolase